MYRRKSIFIMLLALMIFVLGTAQSSDRSQADSKESISTIMAIAPDESVATTVRDNMRVEVASSQPRVLFGLSTATEGASAEARARSFLSDNAGLLHLYDSDLNDLRLQISQTSISGSTVRMSQFVSGVPVYNGEVVVHMNHDGVVTYVTNDYRSNVGGLDVVPTISADAARQGTLNHLGLQGELTLDSSRLVVYALSGKARLAWEVRLISNGTIGDFEALVDAQNGKFIKVGDISIYETGTGNVFDPDPLTTAAATYGDIGFDDNSDADSTQLSGEMVNVTLQDITLSGGMYQLDGPYAAIRDSESPNNGLFSQATNTFNFNRFDDGFEAVNTYYHIDSSMRYLNLTLGVTVAPTQYTGGVRFDPHGLSGSDNSHYSSGSGEVALGEGGVDDAEDSDV
ncbi:MAG: PepSY domain-containing protein, partial [Methylococcales bacterium]|nr:PepSY domain-containing protein [Methylococcales bacterium]